MKRLISLAVMASLSITLNLAHAQVTPYSRGDSTMGLMSISLLVPPGSDDALMDCSLMFEFSRNRYMFKNTFYGYGLGWMILMPLPSTSHLLTLPTRIGYSLKISETSHFDAYAGPRFSYLLSSSYYSDGSDHDVDLSGYSFGDRMSVLLDIGIRFNIKGCVSIGAVYMHDLLGDGTGLYGVTLSIGSF